MQVQSDVESAGYQRQSMLKSQVEILPIHGYTITATNNNKSAKPHRVLDSPAAGRDKSKLSR